MRDAFCSLYSLQKCYLFTILSFCDSDEAVAAFVETSGKLLKELSLNNVRKVPPYSLLPLSLVVGINFPFGVISRVSFIQFL